MLESQNYKESYVQKRTEILQKLEGVIDKLILRADKANGKDKINLLHHVIKIKIKKIRTAIKLRQLKETDYENWNSLKVNVEISLKELRLAFLKASDTAKKDHNASDKPIFRSKSLLTFDNSSK